MGGGHQARLALIGFRAAIMTGVEGGLYQVVGALQKAVEQVHDRIRSLQSQPSPQVVQAVAEAYANLIVTYDFTVKEVTRLHRDEGFRRGPGLRASPYRQGVWPIPHQCEALSRRNGPDQSTRGVTTQAMANGSVLYWPSEQDSPEVRAALVGMAPYSGYVTLPGHRSEGGLDTAEFGVLSGQEVARALDQGDPDGLMPVVVAVCNGVGFAADVWRNSPRAVWASPDTVFYGTDGRITAERATSRSDRVAGSWVLLLPADKKVAARFLWGELGPTPDSASVAQWQWLGERGLRPGGVRDDLATLDGLPMDEVLRSAERVLGRAVSVVDADGVTHPPPGSGSGERVWLLQLPNGQLAGVKAFSSDLRVVLDEQAPPGLRSRPLGGPSVLPKQGVRLYKPPMGLVSAVTMALSAAAIWLTGNPVTQALPIGGRFDRGMPRSVTRPALLTTRDATGAPGRVGVYFQTHDRDGTFVSPLALVEQGGASHLMVGAAQLTLNFTALRNNDTSALHPVLTLNGKAPNDTQHAQLWPALETVREGGVPVFAMLGGAGANDLNYIRSQADPDETHWATTFPQLYPLLRDYLREHNFDGIDLFRGDSNYMSAFDYAQLVDALRADFGTDFIITMSYRPLYTEMRPVEAAIEAIKEKVDWFHIFGHMRFDELLDDSDRASGAARLEDRCRRDDQCAYYAAFEAPALTGRKVNSTVMGLKRRYRDLGGFAGWEYDLEDATWAQQVSAALSITPLPSESRIVPTVLDEQSMGGLSPAAVQFLRRTTGRLTVRYPNGKVSQGSGVVVHSDSGDLVITAGHMVMDEKSGSYASSISFTPGYGSSGKCSASGRRGCGPRRVATRAAGASAPMTWP